MEKSKYTIKQNSITNPHVPITKLQTLSIHGQPSLSGAPSHQITRRQPPGILWCHQYVFHWASKRVQFSSVTQSCPTLCDLMNRSTPGLPVHHQLPEFTQTHVHRVGDAIQPSHPLPTPSHPAPNPSQHQGLFQWVNSLHEGAKVLEFQLQHQS